MSLLFFRETNVWMCTYLYKKTPSSPSFFLFKLAITTCFLNIHVDLCDISLFKSRCVYSNNKASNKARVCFSLPIHSLLESYSLQLWSSHSLFLFGSKVCGFWRENPLYLSSVQYMTTLPRSYLASIPLLEGKQYSLPFPSLSFT